MTQWEPKSPFSSCPSRLLPPPSPILLIPLILSSPLPKNSVNSVIPSYLPPHSKSSAQISCAIRKLSGISV
jgi:hypothetical protein